MYQLYGRTRVGRYCACVSPACFELLRDVQLHRCVSLITQMAFAAACHVVLAQQPTTGGSDHVHVIRLFVWAHLAQTVRVVIQAFSQAVQLIDHMMR